MFVSKGLEKELAQYLLLTCQPLGHESDVFTISGIPRNISSYSTQAHTPKHTIWQYILTPTVPFLISPSTRQSLWFSSHSFVTPSSLLSPPYYFMMENHVDSHCGALFRARRRWTVRPHPPSPWHWSAPRWPALLRRSRTPPPSSSPSACE